MNIMIVGHTSMAGKRIMNMLRRSSRFTIFTVGRHNDASIFLDFENGQTIINNKNLPVMDIVINCVSSFESENHEGVIKNIKVNTQGVAYLLKVLDNIGFHKLINLSTISSINHDENEYYGSYGISKRHGYEYFKYYCDNNNRQLINLLLGPLYDEYGEAQKHQNFLYYIFNQSYLRKEITIYGKKDVYRNYLHVIDLVNIVLRLINVKIDSSEEFICCNTKNYSINEVASLSNKVFNNTSEIRFLAYKEDLKTIYIPKDQRLFELIDYYPKIDLSHGIELYKEQLQIKNYKV